MATYRDRPRRAGVWEQREAESGGGGRQAVAEPGPHEAVAAAAREEQREQVAQLVAARREVPERAVEGKAQGAQRTVEIAARIAAAHPAVEQRGAELLWVARGEDRIRVPAHQLQLQHEAVGEPRCRGYEEQGAQVPKADVHGVQGRGRLRRAPRLPRRPVRP